MKRLSERQRQRSHWRSRRRERLRKIGRGSKVARRATIASRSEFFRVRAQLPKPSFDFETYKPYAAFQPPANFSLTKNYEDTLQFILDLQLYFNMRRKMPCPDGLGRNVYADFAKITNIEPGAGLVLAAEIDRWSRGRGRRPEIHDHLWQSNVSDYFLEAGLFDLLGVDPKSVKVAAATDPGRKTLHYITGRTSSGSDADGLRQRLETLSERSIGPRPQVYNAISEAITNVSHAYPGWHRRWPGRTKRRWWASGFWSESSKTVGVQLYDHGAGIPRTLPRKIQWPRVSKILPSLDPERTDAGLIEAALEYGRTSTGQRGRGKGLAEMAEWIENTGSGFLRILSNGGCITYLPGGSVKRINYRVPFCGTLVEWELKLA